ncbi:MAG: hypothetical protein IKQ45_03635 [Clostridia bacterium]|nr:hypothetical protein [Clostridia bacterium]
MKRKTVILLLLTAILTIGMIVPAAAETDGGWKINKKVGTYLTKAETKVFEKAVEKLGGVAYTPVFTLAKQVVAGTNYAFFCKAVTATAKASTSWKVVIVYQDLQGNAEVLAVNSFNYKNIKTRKNPYTAASVAGAWEYSKKTPSSKGLPSTAKKVFKKATKEYTGVGLTALALLGTQQVAGVNYKYLCSGVLSDAAGTVCLYEVTVYQDLKGDCVITDCNVINLKKYLQY